uniref:Secreted protein n=1 Tax=Ascaris lumbricoides TaxID=6252 RepID=A0A0M3I9Q6_ASCLU
METPSKSTVSTRYCIPLVLPLTLSPPWVAAGALRVKQDEALDSTLLADVTFLMSKADSQSGQWLSKYKQIILSTTSLWKFQC